MNKHTIYVLLWCLLLSACGSDNETPSQTSAPVQVQEDVADIPQVVTDEPEGVVHPMGKDSYISKKGLDIHTDAPDEGAAKVAWDFLDYKVNKNMMRHCCY